MRLTSLIRCSKLTDYPVILAAMAGLSSGVGTGSLGGGRGTRCLNGRRCQVDRFDVIIIGMGTGGESAADRLLDAGRRVAPMPGTAARR